MNILTFFQYQVGDPTFNAGRVSSLLGTGLLLRDWMAFLREGGACGG